MRPFLLAFLSLWVFSSPALANSPYGCPNFETPIVTITPLRAYPRIDRSRNLDDLARLAHDNARNFSSTRHESPVGLTAASLTLDSSYKIATQEVNNGSTFCAQIRSFDLRLGFEESTIYISREIQGQSCGYGLVLEHEQRHVKTDNAVVEAYSFPISQEIERKIKSIGMIKSGSATMAKHRVQEEIDHYIKQLGNELAEIRQKAQAKIDTPEEYDRLSRSCNGELGHLISQYSRRR